MCVGCTYVCVCACMFWLHICVCMPVMCLSVCAGVYEPVCMSREGTQSLCSQRNANSCKFPQKTLKNLLKTSHHTTPYYWHTHTHTYIHIIFRSHNSSFCWHAHTLTLSYGTHTHMLNCSVIRIHIFYYSSTYTLTIV